jgi:hypothetical protein
VSDGSGVHRVSASSNTGKARQRRVAILTCGTLSAVLLVLVLGASLSVTGGLFFVRHRAFLCRVYAVAGVAPAEVERHMHGLASGKLPAMPAGLTRDALIAQLGAPDTVSEADQHGDIRSPAGATSVLYYRDGVAVACFHVDADGRVLLLRTYDVEYFQ